ncbi:MAG: signal recognition particle receptor subunit alpha [Candidatus Pacearchaeota archaeon]
MVLEKLGEAIRRATNKIANAIFLDKNIVDSVIRELQRALIEADVNLLLIKEISDKIRKASLDERVKGVEKREHIIKLLHDELLRILGEHKQLKLIKEKGKQNRILMVGLYGVGKTTTIAKLGNYFSKRGYKTILVGLDTHRPAAQDQLKQLAEKNKLNYFVDMNEKDAIILWKRIEPRIKDYDVIILDTAGRHALDASLINEIDALSKEILPTETILVMPADIGQAAKKQVQEFKRVLNISGIIITRMDSTAKGGGALTACAETNAPVYFITTGEKINDIEEFNPKSFLSQLLGIGDLETLIEKVKLVTEEKTKVRFEEGKFSLEDFVKQVKSMNNLGGFEKIKSLIPGFLKVTEKIPEEIIENQENRIAKWEHIIKSMTLEERENPDLLEKQTSRISRVAKGAGVNNTEVRSLLKQYKMIKSLLKSHSSNIGEISEGLTQKQLQKLVRKFGKKMKF